MDTSLRVAYAPQIAAAAGRHHLDPRLLAAVAAQETGGPGRDSGRNVVGDGGHGRGLFQIDDRWHPFARSPAAMDPARNADYAAELIAGGLKRYGGDVRAALSSYNTGSPTAGGTRTDWGDGRPVGYADSVLRHYERLAGGGAPDRQATPPDARDVAARADPLREAVTRLAPAWVPWPFTAVLDLPPRVMSPRTGEHAQRDLAPADDDDRADPSGDLATA